MTMDGEGIKTFPVFVLQGQEVKAAHEQIEKRDFKSNRISSSS